MTVAADCAVAADSPLLDGAGSPASAPTLRRPLPRPLRAGLLAVGLGLGGWYLFEEPGQLPRLLAAVATVDPWWLALAALATAATFAASTVSVIGASGGSLPWWPTTAVELAGTAANRVTPAGLGRSALLARYYQRSGRTWAQAVTASSVNAAAGVVVHVVALLATGTLVLSATTGTRRAVPGWTGPLVVLVLLVAAVVAVRTAARWRPLLLEAGRQLAVVVRRPSSALALLGGSVGVNAAFVLVLYASVRAAGGSVDLTATAFVYLGVSALASATPVPGGLGVVEAALVAGLTGSGVDAATAVTAVLVYRLLTYWAPILPGLWCLRLVRRRRLV